MKRSDLAELHFITPIANVPSIVEHGILCHKKAKKLAHHSVAMPEIQDIRARKVVPGGRPLHEYANLYIHARNPMMYKRLGQHFELCVLRVNTDVLDLSAVVIADGNAASDYTGFWPSPAGLEKVDRDLVFAESWTDSDPIVKWRRARVRSAEALVPDKVDPVFVIGVYVSCQEAEEKLRRMAPGLNVTINAHLFFMA